MKFLDRLISYFLVQFFKLFPALYKTKILRKFFTKNYTSGLLAIGERLHRFEYIGFEWIYLDIKDCDFPIEFNSSKQLPFDDNSQKLIYSTHMIEHLEPKDLEVFVKECLRVLKPGGYLRFEAPCANKLVNAYKGETPSLVRYFHEDISQRLVPLLNLDDRYKEEHIGILGVLSCYIAQGCHMPVYVDKETFDQKIHSLSLEELEVWLQTLQTEEQKKTHGHNCLIYFEKLKKIAQENGASRCWEVDFGKTHIPFLYLNNIYRRHKDTIIEGLHRIEYSTYFEAQKRCA